jgi:hypothetical protein
MRPVPGAEWFLAVQDGLHGFWVWLAYGGR